jgi:MYXO-CTERM domain-containing protein
MTDNRTCCAGRDVDIFALDATFTTLPIGTPQLVTSIFEARSGTFSFNFTGSANLGYLGGYQLRDLGAARSDVPEPASALLGLLGLAGLARRRRRAA